MAPLEVLVKPVTSKDDVPDLARISEGAVDTEFLDWVRLFTKHTQYEATAKAVTEALTDPTYNVMKAVVPESNSPSGEKIVGFIHWMCGYIVLDKVDPFALTDASPVRPVVDTRGVSSNQPEELAATATDSEETPSRTENKTDRDARLRAGEAKYVETRNHYIATIRGKKHMFIRRIMVLPEYQRRGIASKLLRIVTDDADELKIVCWLFSRPAGEKLYEREGFATVAVTEMDEKAFDFVCARAKAMIRLPKSLDR